MDYGKRKKRIYCIKINFKPNEDNKDKVKIFGKDFLIINKNKCKIIYENRIYELKEYFEDIITSYNHKDQIKFKVIFFYDFIALSKMFCNCNSLISLSVNDESKINT